MAYTVPGQALSQKELRRVGQWDAITLEQMDFEISNGDDECNYVRRRERAHSAEHLLRNAVPGC